MFSIAVSVVLFITFVAFRRAVRGILDAAASSPRITVCASFQPYRLIRSPRSHRIRTTLRPRGDSRDMQAAYQLLFVSAQQLSLRGGYPPALLH
jgi:hypothetical protein